MGADDYICKPFTFNKLNTSIRAALPSWKAQSTNINLDSGVLDRDSNNSCESGQFNEIDAIAYGVDARIDYLDGHSDIVDNVTIKVARQIGLPEEDIEKWAFARFQFYTEREKQIESLLGNFQTSQKAKKEHTYHTCRTGKCKNILFLQKRKNLFSTPT